MLFIRTHSPRCSSLSSSPDDPMPLIRTNSGGWMRRGAVTGEESTGGNMFDDNISGSPKLVQHHKQVPNKRVGSSVWPAGAAAKRKKMKNKGHHQHENSTALVLDYISPSLHSIHSALSSR